MSPNASRIGFKCDRNCVNPRSIKSRLRAALSSLLSALSSSSNFAASFTFYAFSATRATVCRCKTRLPTIQSPTTDKFDVKIISRQCRRHSSGVAAAGSEKTRTPRPFHAVRRWSPLGSGVKWFDNKNSRAAKLEFSREPSNSLPSL